MRSTFESDASAVRTPSIRGEEIDLTIDLVTCFNDAIFDQIKNLRPIKVRMLREDSCRPRDRESSNRMMAIFKERISKALHGHANSEDPQALRHYAANVTVIVKETLSNFDPRKVSRTNSVANALLLGILRRINAPFALAMSAVNEDALVESLAKFLWSDVRSNSMVAAKNIASINGGRTDHPS